MRMILTIAFALAVFSALADPSDQQPEDQCHVSDQAGFHCHETALGTANAGQETDQNITE